MTPGLFAAVCLFATCWFSFRAMFFFSGGKIGPIWLPTVLLGISVVSVLAGVLVLVPYVNAAAA